MLAQRRERSKPIWASAPRDAEDYLFAGSDAGAERAAIAYTILGSFRLAGVDPLEYLRDGLPRMTRKVQLLDLSQLLPSRWAAARGIAKA